MIYVVSFRMRARVSAAGSTLDRRMWVCPLLPMQQEFRRTRSATALLAKRATLAAIPSRDLLWANHCHESRGWVQGNGFGNGIGGLLFRHV